MFDIARIEVLKGPQGTLEGRNAAAGAINVITNRPDVDNFETSASVTAGNYGLWSTEGMINIPVNNKLAFRAAFQTVDHDGYIAHVYNDAKDAYGRVEAALDTSGSPNHFQRSSTITTPVDMACPRISSFRRHISLDVGLTDSWAVDSDCGHSR